jgi:hypothetical protein
MARISNIASLLLVTPDLNLSIQSRHSLTTANRAFETPEGGEMGSPEVPLA